MTVPKAGGTSCETCGRHVYKRGVTLVVEAAVNPKGISEIIEQLREMSTGSRRVRERRQDILARFSELSAYGQLEVPDQMRQLRGELWEIKTSEDRVPFYRRTASGHQLAARVLFVFDKGKNKTAQDKTPRKVFDRGEWIMKGDQNIGKINAPEIASA